MNRIFATHRPRSFLFFFLLFSGPPFLYVLAGAWTPPFGSCGHKLKLNRFYYTDAPFEHCTFDRVREIYIKCMAVRDNAGYFVFFFYFSFLVYLAPVCVHDRWSVWFGGFYLPAVFNVKWKQGTKKLHTLTHFKKRNKKKTEPFAATARSLRWRC